MPSALQFIVTGSLRGTVVSMGCSTIRGTWKAAKRVEEKLEVSETLQVNFKRFGSRFLQNNFQVFHERPMTIKKILISDKKAYMEICCARVFSHFSCPTVSFSNLIKLKVLFLLFSIFLCPFILHPLRNQIMDFQHRRLPNQQNTNWH